ncbi:succinate dehydrogenase assembly factor 1, mitochondrial isoform 1-T4 [Thomomys bottae]
MSRLSRMQKQILSLYRELLRAGRGKPGAEARIRAEFRQQAGLPRSDVLRIEYLYRRGRRQLQLLRSGHATAMGAFVRPRGPGEEPGDTTAGAPGTPPDDGHRPREAHDHTGAPETQPGDRRRSLPLGGARSAA